MALPVVSDREIAKALEGFGYVLDRQKGSHMVLRQTVSPTAASPFRTTRKSPREHSGRS